MVEAAVAVVAVVDADKREPLSRRPQDYCKKKFQPYIYKVGLKSNHNTEIKS